jgi:hypothetical protein
MHKHMTHNKCYTNSRESAQAILTFLREKVPPTWAELSDTVTDNFRVVAWAEDNIPLRCHRANSTTAIVTYILAKVI